MNRRETKKITVNGVVQAVGFRPFVYRIAVDNSLDGWVKNLGDAGVEIVVAGKPDNIGNFLSNLEHSLPPLAEIEDLQVNPGPKDVPEKFSIRQSSSGGQGSGTVPPDVATCEKCLEDVFGDTRYRGYWATSCVNCGPRFSVIRKLPYDRPNTSMNEFPMCSSCHNEYTDPNDRRYHAQTIACPNCGPSIWYEKGGKVVEEGTDSIRHASEMIEEEKILAIKGVGGCHIACRADRRELVDRLREGLGRPQQPFAVMAPEERVGDIVRVSGSEKELLTSPRRPIMVLPSYKGNYLAENVAPGLHTVGLMLPYSALHHILFQDLDYPLVMTSANLPGRPMLVENEQILEGLEDIVDGFLLHNRSVVSRCDDSVVRQSGGTEKFIRRSRGWVPTPQKLEAGPESLLALGAEQDNVIGIYDEGKAYLSQYLGDIDNPDSLSFLRNALDRLLSLTGISMPSKVAHDTHPLFLTTELAEKIGEESHAIQHHRAHFGSLLGESGLDRAVGLVMDGAGYGDDGSIWGCELFLRKDGQISRRGSLTPAYMPGGDLATKHPARMVAGILYPLFEDRNEDDLLRFLHTLGLEFPGGEEELVATVRQLYADLNVTQTTSAGRFLDAVSSLVGACNERTYEGEPAMKLESFASRGSPRQIELPLIKTQGLLRLDQNSILKRLVELRERLEPADLAATGEWAIAEGMSKLAIDVARKHGISHVGLSGGVAYNDRISALIRQRTREAGLEYFTNEAVPPGDGGVAFGQLWVVGRMSS